MNAPATIRQAYPVLGAFDQRESRIARFRPPADAPVLHGTPGPVRVATAEHHEPKAYS